jgi:hypothetical protein
LLTQDDALLDGHTAGAVDQVRPAVAKMAQPGAFAAIVAPHVAPSLSRAVVAQPPVKLYVNAPFFDQYVEILGAISETSGLAPSRREAVLAAELGVSQFERRLCACLQVGQRLDDDPSPAGLRV